MAADPIVAAVIADLERRSAAGIEKYGTTLAGNPAPAAHWLQQAYEEALDLALYQRRAMMEAEKQAASIEVQGSARARAAVGPNGNIDPATVAPSREAVLEQWFRLYQADWHDAEAAGWRVIPVTILPTAQHEVLVGLLSTLRDNPPVSGLKKKHINDVIAEQQKTAGNAVENPPSAVPMGKLLRFDDLVELGVVQNRTTLYRWIREKNFPKPVKLGTHSVAWREDEVEAWVNSWNGVGPS